MPVLLATGHRDGRDVAAAAEARSDSLEIGLLNNLSDAGLAAGERQFVSLLEAAADRFVIRLRLYVLPQIARGMASRERIGALYSDLPGLMSGRLDGLIVTGCEPVAPALSVEAYWPGLTAIIDWAEHHTTSTIWSCLAAHAAVLHLDGVERRRLPAKRHGVFSFASESDHPLLAGGGASRTVPHSRLNDLSGDDLAAHGYSILTHSPEAGVDMFVKRWRSLFVYLQGHPEYDAAALMREYRRDVARFLEGASEGFPVVPAHYFPRPVEAALRDFETLARIERESHTLAALPIGAEPEVSAAPWRLDAVRLMRNWLSYLAAHKS